MCYVHELKNIRCKGQSNTPDVCWVFLMFGCLFVFCFFSRKIRVLNHHRTIEWCGLEEILKISSFKSPATGKLAIH